MIIILFLALMITGNIGIDPSPYPLASRTIEDWEIANGRTNPLEAD